GDTTYASTSATTTITILPPTPTFVVNSVSATYDGQAHGTTGEVFGLNGADLGPATITYSGGTTPVHAGTYTATASFAGNQDYTSASATTTVTITRAASTIVVSPTTVTFTGQTVTVSAEVYGVNGSDLGPAGGHTLDNTDLGPAVITYSNGAGPV